MGFFLISNFLSQGQKSCENKAKKNILHNELWVISIVISFL